MKHVKIFEGLHGYDHSIQQKISKVQSALTPERAKWLKYMIDKDQEQRGANSPNSYNMFKEIENIAKKYFPYF